MSNDAITDIPTLDQFSAEEIRAWRASRVCSRPISATGEEEKLSRLWWRAAFL